MVNTQSTMGLKTDLLKQILDLKLKRATEVTQNQIQKLQQKVDEMIDKEKEDNEKN